MKSKGYSPSHIFDCIGVGFGPSNIALAIALEEKGMELNALFLEAMPEADWQGEMTIPGSDIQHNPLRDFVTPRNPRSRYGFLSYLKAEGRIFDYLNLDAPFPPRSEYTQYVCWVAKHFDRMVRYSTRVAEIAFAEQNGEKVVSLTSDTGAVYLTRSVSFAPGRSNLIPEVFRESIGDRMIHASAYRSGIARWQEDGDVKRIAVIGGSQSAVEILLDLPATMPDAKVTGILRSQSLKQKDLSAFTEEIYGPNFVGSYYNAPADVQHELRQELWRSNYGAADHDVINQLHFRLYEQKVTGSTRIRLLNNCQISRVRPKERGWVLEMKNRMSRIQMSHEFDAVILATGFLNHGRGEGLEPAHPLLRGIAGNIAFRSDGAVDVQRDYRLVPLPAVAGSAPIFLNGICETTHGFGDAGSFSLLSLRSMEIAESIAAELSRRRKRQPIRAVEMVPAQ